MLGRPFEEDHRQGSTDVVAVGSLACPYCDAPIGIGAEPLSPRTPLSCPFCGHAGALRDFLSLASPTRPTRVVVCVTAPARLRISSAG